MKKREAFAQPSSEIRVLNFFVEPKKMEKKKNLQVKDVQC
jgi:hypothetical protein